MRWLQSHWGDVEYLLEVGDDDWVQRQVELVGDERRPAGATSLAEWLEALAAGRLAEYTAVYSHRLADQPVNEWDAGWPHDVITSASFEAEWSRARAFVEEHGPDNSAL